MNMKIWGVLMAWVISAPTWAADHVDIKITGRIIASPCIFNGGDNSLNINLGNIQAMNMATARSSSDPVLFDLRFTECPAGTQTVTTTFTGITDPDAGADYYKNSGSATRVAIGLAQGTTGERKGSGSSITQSVMPDRTVTMGMKAWVYAHSGGATPGTVNSAVVLTMQYN